MYHIAVEQNVRCAVRDLNTRGRRCIVMVHGWPFDSSLYEWQLSQLPAYNIRCVGVDMRGFGASDQPFSGYSYNRLADDLCHIINRIDVNNVILCGFSLGAAVCIRYMTRHRGYKVSRLMLCSAAAPTFAQKPGNSFGMTREQIDNVLLGLYQDRFSLYESYCRQCFSSLPSEALQRHFQLICGTGAQQASIKTLEAMRDEDLRADLAGICVPTAILHGANDVICPFSLAEELQNGIRNSFIVRFEQSGHCPFYEEKDAFNRTLVDFINSAPRSK